MEEIEFDADIPIINPKTEGENPKKNRYAKVYWNQRHRRAAKVKSAIITSSPGFNPNPIIAICKVSVPLAQGITCFTPK